MLKLRSVIITLGFLLSFASPSWAAEGADGHYEKVTYAPLMPVPALTPIMQLRGTTDNSGNLNVTNTSLGTGNTPLTAIGNLPGRTDSNGNLYINCISGCSSIGGSNTQVLYNNNGAQGGITGVTTDGTGFTLVTITSGSVIKPTTDSTTAEAFTKADGTTPVLRFDTTNNAIGVGAAAPFATVGGNQVNFNTTGYIGLSGLRVNGADINTIYNATGPIGIRADVTTPNPAIVLKNASNGFSIGGSTSGGGLYSNNAVGTDKGADTINVVNPVFVQGIAHVFNVNPAFTTAANTNLQTITGLSWTLPANTALNVPFSCKIVWQQGTAAVVVSFGLQTDTVTPTNFLALGQMETNLTVTSYQDVSIANTTPTVLVTGTPAATGTTYNAYIDGFLENPSNASTTTVNVMVKTATAGDAVTISRGSFCRVF